MKLPIRPSILHRPLADAGLRQVRGGDGTTIQAPRDIPTGQSSGRRQHGEIRS